MRKALRNLNKEALTPKTKESGVGNSVNGSASKSKLRSNKAKFNIGDEVVAEKVDLGRKDDNLRDLGTHYILGTVKYVGTVMFSTGIWVGIEVSKGEGSHDGMFMNKRYFTCAPQKGTFVRSNACSLATEELKSSFFDDEFDNAGGQPVKIENTKLTSNSRSSSSSSNNNNNNNNNATSDIQQELNSDDETSIERKDLDMNAVIEKVFISICMNI